MRDRSGEGTGNPFVKSGLVKGSGTDKIKKREFPSFLLYSRTEFFRTLSEFLFEGFVKIGIIIESAMHTGFCGSGAFP